MLKQRRALLLYIEPTPYIVQLVKKIRMQFPGEVEAFYITENLSQDWRIELTVSCGKLLPVERWRAVNELWRSLNQLRPTNVVHLAGWGHPLLLAALLIGKLRQLHVSVESDTARGQAISGWKALVKNIVYPRLFRLADHFLPGGKRAAAYLASYGVPDSKITIAQMTVDVEIDPPLRRKRGRFFTRFAESTIRVLGPGEGRAIRRASRAIQRDSRSFEGVRGSRCNAKGCPVDGCGARQSDPYGE